MSLKKLDEHLAIDEDTGVVYEMPVGKAGMENSMEFAQQVARKLKEQIDKKDDKWAVDVKKDNKKYLRVEAWQFIGACFGYRAVLDGRVERDDIEPNAWIARAKVFDSNGLEVGSGDSICGTEDEPMWSKQPTLAKKSMVQTRAFSRAYRSCLAWVAVLAGYEATPYEEMDKFESKDNANKPVYVEEFSENAEPWKLKPISQKQISKIRGMCRDNAEETTLVQIILSRVFPDDEPRQELSELNSGQASDIITQLVALQEERDRT